MRVLATVHASSVEALRQRPLFRELLDARIFELAAVITKRDGRRVYRVETL